MAFLVDREFHVNKDSVFVTSSLRARLDRGR